MPTFDLYFNTTATAFVSIDADSLDEAIDLAGDRLPANVCAQCAGMAWHSDRAGIDLAGEWELDEGAYTDYPED